MTSDTTLRIAAAQIAPVWGDRAGTLAKILAAVDEAAGEGKDGKVISLASARA